MYIKLSVKDAKQLKEHINGSKKYSILEAVQVIEFLEKEALRLEVVERVIVNVREGNKVVLRDEIALGQGDGIHYLVYLENKLKKLSPESGFELTGDKKQIIERLKELYEVGNSENNQSAKFQTSNEGAPMTETSILQRVQSLIREQTILVVGITLLVISVIGLSTYYALTPPVVVKQPKQSIQLSVSSTISESESADIQFSTEELSTLLEQKRFEEAMSFYPQEYPFIERSIFYLEAEGIPYLEDFLKMKDYGKGWFDLAYLKRDYAKVVELKQEADTDERLVQLAVAYVKTGAIAEAEALNGQLMVESINTMIVDAKETQAIQFIKEGNWDAAQQIQTQINSERIRLFYEELSKTDAAIQELNEKLTKPELKEEEKKTIEGQRQQLEQHKQRLIEAL